jgi:hypothetical protein
VLTHAGSRLPIPLNVSITSLELTLRNGKGRTVFFVRETHGYFDDTRKQLKNMTETFNPNEPFETWDEAQLWYQKQIEYRASRGFVHAFVFDPMSPNAVRYRLLR